MAESKMLSAIPVLLSRDVGATAAFYTTKLGFTNVYQDSGFLILQRDDIQLHFTECDEQHLVDWSSCRVEVEGVDSLYAECSVAGIVHPNSSLEDTGYGTREFGMLDSQGVLITFFQRNAQVR